MDGSLCHYPKKNLGGGEAKVNSRSGKGTALDLKRFFFFFFFKNRVRVSDGKKGVLISRHATNVCYKIAFCVLPSRTRWTWDVLTLRLKPIRTTFSVSRVAVGLSSPIQLHSILRSIEFLSVPSAVLRCSSQGHDLKKKIRCRISNVVG